MFSSKDLHTDTFWYVPLVHGPSSRKGEEDTTWSIRKKLFSLGYREERLPWSWVMLPSAFIPTVGGFCLKTGSQLERQMGFSPFVSGGIFSVLWFT